VDEGLEKEDENEYVVKDVGSEAASFRLRMCVYSGEHLPRERSYIVVTVGAGTEHEKKITSVVASESEHPLWEFALDEEIKVEGISPRVDIRIFGKRMVGGDRLVGTATVRLPVQAMESPKKQELRLVGNASMFAPMQWKAGHTGRITVVWQVCNIGSYALDLNRVAEMDGDDMEKTNHTVILKVLKLSLKQSLPQQGVNVTAKLTRLDGNERPLTRVSPETMTWPSSGNASSTANLTEESLLACRDASWMEEGRPGCTLDPWVMHESKVTLMNWFLDITVSGLKIDTSMEETSRYRNRRVKRLSTLLRRKAETSNSTEIGSWREPLSDLLQTISENGHALRFDADLGPRAGVLAVELDIFTDRPHKSLLSLKGDAAIVNAVSQVPVRLGMPPESKWGDKVRYCCSFFADGLPFTQQCRPYIRIVMGNASAMTDVQEQQAVNDVFWNQPATIDTTRFYRKATVELYHCVDPKGGRNPEADTLMGTQTIYDVSLDKEYWIHYYGGAVNAPHKDIAQNMVKGALRPPSTYQGSVAVHLGSKRLSRDDFVAKVQAKRATRRLVVRLHRGVYLETFKGKKVNVLVQLAGCRLPDTQEAQRLLKLRAAERKAKETGETIDVDAAQRLASEVTDPARLNRNILSFPGEVNDAGVLVFTQPTADGYAHEHCDWVELRSLKDFPLKTPPGETHVYLYVVPVGEEKEAPQVFARLRMNMRLPGEPNATPPRWRRLRWDRSVVDTLPPSYYSQNLAGYILGSAALMAVHDEDCAPGGELANFPVLDRALSSKLLPTAVAAPWLCGAGPCVPSVQQMMSIGSIGEPSELTRGDVRPNLVRTVYCHIDVLAARELPAMDEDGLMDPSYSIHVLDQQLILPAGIHKTTSPTFMHRLVIPFQIECEEGPEGKLMVACTTPMPPVIVKVLDYDKSSSVFESSKFENVGSVVVKHTPAAGTAGQWIYKMLDYDEKTAEVAQSGCEFSESSPLDLNNLQKASWYSLDAPGKAPFDSAAGGVDETWHQRPRVLLAVGYSLQEATAPSQFGNKIDIVNTTGATAWHIESTEKACYQIDVDLMGLRNLPQGLLNQRLTISSFWDGPRVEFDVASSKDHNFHQAGESTQEMAGFAEKMKPLIRLTKSDSRSHSDHFTHGDTVTFDELIGVRVRAPIYRVPVIPYLQTLWIKPGKWKMEDQDSGESVEFSLFYSSSRGCLDGAQICKSQDGGEASFDIHDGHIFGDVVEWRACSRRWRGVLSDCGACIIDLMCYYSEDEDDGSAKRYIGKWQEEAKADPFVLLPAITFELTNALTGAVYLTLTVGLNRLLLAAGGPQVKSWTDLSLQEMQTVPLELREWKFSGTEATDGGSPVSMKSTRSIPAKPLASSATQAITSSGQKTAPIRPVSNLKSMEDAYMCFVDVFAAEAGYLTWDSDFRLGRPLSEQCLFSISQTIDALDTEVKVDENARPQYFNPGDWMFRGSDGPFDMRVTPSLSCHSATNLDPLRRSLDTSLNQFPAVTLTGLSHGPKLDQLRGHLRTALGRINEILQPKVVGFRKTKPLGPGALFKSVLGPTGCVKKEDLRNMSTRQIKERLGKHGWRANSHLCAPEKEKINPAQLFEGEHLSANSHTFMRPVGHIINSKDRDSRILARLQMGLPLHALEDLADRLQAALDFEMVDETAKALIEEEKRWHSAGAATVNYLVIKFKLNGMVIWTAPEENAYWGRPGSPLFAVRLLDSPDVVVPVLVPSFDIRRKVETAWYPVKTLRDRFSTLLGRIQQQADGDSKRTMNKRWSRARAIRQQNRECPSGIEALEGYNDQVDDAAVDPDDVDIYEPDGYTRPIAVAKNAFICRIRRRMGVMAFDRPQTKNWFRTCLEDSFPEFKTLPSDKDDRDAHKQYIMSRFMNVRQKMSVGLDRSGSALLKGHISCKRVQDPDQEQHQEQDGLPKCTAPPKVDPCSRPVENLWISETVFVRVFVLSAHKLDIGSLGIPGISNFKPYITANLGSESQQGALIESLPPGPNSVNFYQKFVFQSTFPGTALLNIDIRHKGLVGDSIVGTATVDIEDRILALRRKAFRQSSNKVLLEKSIAPKEVVKWKKEKEFLPNQMGWIDPEDPEPDPVYGIALKPHRGFAEPSPIEIWDLVRQDEELSEEGRSGLLRFWIDLAPVGSHLPDDPEICYNTQFEVRITVYEVNNIKIFRDFGERNDVYVKGEFRAADYDNGVTVQPESTDTHKFARKLARFNWNWSFTCTAPASECEIEFTLMDADKIGDNDLIYYPKTYSLDHHIWLAYREWRQGRPPLGSLTDTVVFDRWPKVKDPMPTCSCSLWRRMTRGLDLDRSTFACMKIGIQVVPKDQADSIPFTTGQFSTPRDRFSYVSALENPNGTARMLLGPTRYYKLKAFVGFWIVVIGLLLLASTVYYILMVTDLAS